MTGICGLWIYLWRVVRTVQWGAPTAADLGLSRLQVLISEFLWKNGIDFKMLLQGVMSPPSLLCAAPVEKWCRLQDVAARCGVPSQPPFLSPLCKNGVDFKMLLQGVGISYTHPPLLTPLCKNDADFKMLLQGVGIPSSLLCWRPSCVKTV